MLKRLFIKDFILIEELNLDFNNGFSVFTGETGAGKSIFIDCISILIGERMNTSMIRVNCPKAVIEGDFEVDARISMVLEQNGFISDKLTILREITSDGKSTTKINNKNCTLAFIKELLFNQIDIHCQRDNQYLLNEANHISLLDKYVGNETILNELRDNFNNYRDLSKEYQNLLENEFNEAQLEIIRYQVDEIEKAKLKEGEEEEITSIIRNYDVREKIGQLIDKLKDIFDSDHGVLTSLYNFKKLSSQLDNFDNIQDNVKNINDAYYLISDEYSNIMNFFDSVDMDISDIDALNQRLYDIQRIKRKYNLTVPQIIQKCDEFKQQLDLVENRQEVLDKLKKQVDDAYHAYETKALEVRKLRQSGSQSLEKDVISELKDLNLEKAQFSVEFSDGNASALGLDNIRFLLSMNPGQPLRSLSNVASGGELSRLMLGLKNIFARLQNTKLAIFDEIDTGVSGFVAFNMGSKIHNISKDMQVFSVTHLAAVAAHSDYHYHIEKVQLENETKTEITLLNETERIKELAILSSSSVSEASLAAAKELYENAKKVA